MPDEHLDIVTFRDHKAREWLDALANQRGLSRCALARRVFAIGWAIVQAFPQLLDGSVEDEAIRPFLGIPSTAQLARALEEVPDE